MSNTVQTTKGELKRTAAYSRASVRRKVEETVGGTTIPYKLEDDGTEFLIPHPLFYSDEVKDQLKALEDGDEDGTARVLLGDQYDQFVAEGGEGSEITLLQIAVSQDTRSSLTNGRPTTR